jgi:hypothetical protein
VDERAQFLTQRDARGFSPAHIGVRQLHTHRFGRKLKLPSTFVIKYELRQLMKLDLVKKEREAAELKAPQVKTTAFALSVSDGERKIEQSDAKPVRERKASKPPSASPTGWYPVRLF